MRKTSERQFCTVPEAARILEVSPATIWRWIDAEKLPAYRVGPRGIRIKKRDLETVVRPARSKVVTPKEQAVGDIWAGYDSERARRALRRSAGALVGVDRKALLADIHAGREQNSPGRPT